MPDNAVKHKKMSFVIVERLIGMISSGDRKSTRLNSSHS